VLATFAHLLAAVPGIPDNHAWRNGAFVGAKLAENGYPHALFGLFMKKH
jgi:hypothetical protein